MGYYLVVTWDSLVCACVNKQMWLDIKRQNQVTQDCK